MTRRTRIGLRSLPLVFAVQAAEEVWAMPAWAAEHAGRIPRAVSSFMPAEQAVLLGTLRWSPCPTPAGRWAAADT